MCIKTSMRADDMSVEYRDHCVRCNRGWKDEDKGSYCVVDEDYHDGEHHGGEPEEP